MKEAINNAILSVNESIAQLHQARNLMAVYNSNLKDTVDQEATYLEGLVFQMQMEGEERGLLESEEVTKE
jgi:hypothetical protein